MTTPIYDESLSLDQTVYLIVGNEIIESTIRDLDGYIDETTTPHGIAPRVHTRGNELWSWGASGNRPEKLAEFETEAEAVTAMERCHADDFWNSIDFDAYTTREDAESALND